MATKKDSSKAPAVSQTPAKQPPVHVIQLGRIKAAIWANQGDHGPWYGVMLSREYKDGDEWKSSSSFGRDDLLTLAKVADLANTWIHKQSPMSPSYLDDGGLPSS
jgi:hypothetical protein